MMEATVGTLTAADERPCRTRHHAQIPDLQKLGENKYCWIKPLNFVVTGYAAIDK